MTMSLLAREGEPMTQTHQKTGSSQAPMMATVLVLLIFGAGFASGWFVRQLTAPGLHPTSGKSKRYRRKRRRRGQWRKRFLARLTKKLSLSAEQVSKMDAVIRKHQPAYRNIKRSIRPALRKVRKDMRAELKTLLTPVQQKQLEAMIKARKERRARRRKARQAKKQ